MRLSEVLGANVGSGIWNVFLVPFERGISSEVKSSQECVRLVGSS